MNFLAVTLNQLARRQKLAIVLLNDALLALICWVVFGPPMATYIASEFTDEIIDIFYDQWQSFIFPLIFSITYLYIFGFYKSLIKFIFKCCRK